MVREKIGLQTDGHGDNISVFFPMRKKALKTIPATKFNQCCSAKNGQLTIQSLFFSCSLRNYCLTFAGTKFFTTLEWGRGGITPQRISAPMILGKKITTAKPIFQGSGIQ